MPGPGLLLTSVLLPAVVALVVLLVWRSGGRPGGRGAAAGLTLGYFAGEVAHRGLPPFPPAEATQWAPYAVAAAGVLAVVAPAVFVSTAARWAVRALLMAGAFALLLRPLMTHTWTATQSAAWVAGLTVVALLHRVLLDGLVPDSRRGGGFLPLAALAGCAAAAITASGSLALGLVTGSLAAAAGGAFVAAWIRPEPTLGSWGVTPAWIGMAFLVVAAATYSSLPWWSAALLGVAPVAARIVPERRLADRPWWIVEGLRAAAVAGVGAAAVAIAVLLSSSPASDYPY